MARRERYLQEDIKVGASIVDKETGEVIGYKPSKEDSIERLREIGVDFHDEDSFEDTVCDKVMLSLLQEAMKELDNDEKELVSDIYYKNLTTREVADKNNISQPGVVKQHKKVLEKFRKFFK